MFSNVILLLKLSNRLKSKVLGASRAVSLENYLNEDDFSIPYKGFSIFAIIRSFSRTLSMFSNVILLLKLSNWLKSKVLGASRLVSFENYLNEDDFSMHFLIFLAM